MATVEIYRAHELTFSEARQLAKQWQIDGEARYALVGEYTSGDDSDTLVFARKGVQGELVITASDFHLVLHLGFLFSAYQKRIIETINHNLDTQLHAIKSHRKG